MKSTPSVERRLRERLDAVAKRERALARRAGELAAREKALALLAGQVGEREARVKQSEVDAAAAGQASITEPKPAPAAAPEPVVELEASRQVPLEPVRGRWNLHALEALVREHGSTDDSSYHEWTAYLYLLREHADYDGALPATFDALVDGVFGDLVDSAGRPHSPSRG